MRGTRRRTSLGRRRTSRRTTLRRTRRKTSLRRRTSLMREEFQEL